MKKVVISQHRLLHYRVAFFEKLHYACQRAGIDLHLVHGQPTRREARKNDTGALGWAESVCNRYLEVGSRDLLWQPYPKHLRDAELVVLMQENRLLSNYPWIFKLTRPKTRVAFWGHGRNFQSEQPTGLRESWKRYYLGNVDWWFAYTSMTRDFLVSNRYPEERISVLDNAIDNEGFSRDLIAVSEDMLQGLRRDLDIATGAPVGLFCGSLYPDKRIDFLVSAMDLIYQALPNFRMIIIGDGPSAAEIVEAARGRPWLRYVGAQRGLAKAAYFRLGQVILNPGLVGLHVLDAFCAGLPMLTTSDAPHSPEIAYLQNERNGLVCSGGVQDYAESAIRLLCDSEELARLQNGALADSKRFTLDNMVERFVDGLLQCLSKPKKVG